MNRGEIYRTKAAMAERGNKGGYYVVVSRNAVADNDDLETVICAPIYSRWTGLATEVAVGVEDGLEHDSSIRCDFLGLLRKSNLTHFVGRLGSQRLSELNRALALALALPMPR